MDQIVVLAAGKGKRMGCTIPKVLIALSGRPMLAYLLETIKFAGVCPRPTLVVAEDNQEAVKKVADNYDCDYVVQIEQLGTGHAVLSAKEFLKNKADNILVLYGDMPFVSQKTIQDLVAVHHQENKVMTMATITLPDFNDWRTCLYDYGRIIRNNHNEIIDIVEKKDATPAQLEIKEVNPSFFCFQASWLWPSLDKLKNNNAQKEYYLTDLVALAMAEGEKVASLSIAPKDAVGVNTSEQLNLAESLI